MYWCMGIQEKFGKGEIPNAKAVPHPTSKLWMNQKTNVKFVNGEKTDIKKGYVDAHDMNTAFIIPNTKNTGISVALNMQDTKKIEPASVLISHAWNEDMEEVLGILELMKRKKIKMQDGKFFDENTPLWFW